MWRALIGKRIEILQLIKCMRRSAMNCMKLVEDTSLKGHNNETFLEIEGF